MTPKKAKPKKGKLKRNNVRLEPHEERTVDFLREQGYDIELIPPSNSPKSKTPDLMMQGLAWEMKCPQGKSKATLENLVKKATKQSANIIIDLRNTKMDQGLAVKELMRRFNQITSIRRMIIVQGPTIIDIKK